MEASVSDGRKAFIGFEETELSWRRAIWEQALYFS